MSGAYLSQFRRIQQMANRRVTLRSHARILAVGAGR